MQARLQISVVSMITCEGNAARRRPAKPYFGATPGAESTSGFTGATTGACGGLEAFLQAHLPDSVGGHVCGEPAHPRKPEQRGRAETPLAVEDASDVLALDEMLQ